MHSVSVVIPNYNGKHLLEQNLPFVFEALRTAGISHFEVIVADDASQDNSVEFIKRSYPHITLVQNATNVGFSGNINSGIARATQDLVLLLNSDVQLTPEYFQSQLPYFDDPDTFGVMGRIMSMDGRTIQDSAKYPSYSFASIGSTKNYLPHEPTKPVFSWFLSGANALVCRKKLELLGGFREIFNPFYCEDVDLSLRAWRLGFRLYYEHNAICFHPNSETIRKFPSWRVRRVAKRNQMMLHYLHLSAFEILAFMAVTFIKSVFRLFLLNTLYASAFIEFVTLIPSLNREKKSFAALQKQTDQNISLGRVAALIKESIQ